MKNKKKSEYPIDIVIPWVDGNDPAWLKEKAAYSKEITKSVHEYNYQEWGILKYWFRGIEKNAPWVRNVFFVTWGHVPEWLDTKAPKLKIVNHKDFIPDDYLPTFSSHTIELNFHRIKGLAEHFIYFNDDMYLIKPASPEDFFINGLPCDSAVINPIAPANRNCINSLQLTTAAVMNEHFSKKQVMRENARKWFNLKYGKLVLLNYLFLPWDRFPGLLEKHLPSSFLKSTFEEVWREEEGLLDATCRHCFRDFKEDINQWIMKEWQICKGKFEPQSTGNGKLLSVENMDDAIKAAKVIQSKKYKMVCINDHLETADQEVIRTISSAFESIFPEKSSFEI